MKSRSKWLCLLMAVVGLMLGLASRNAHNETPKRLLVDMETQEQDDKYLKQCKLNQFVGVDECKIIFIVTEKGN